MTKHPILFLDFDGVLHDGDAAILDSDGDGNPIAKGENLFCWSPILVNLLKKYPAKVVVHSSWRLFWDHKTLVEQYIPKDLGEFVIDTTPYAYKNRWYSVKKYLDKISDYKENEYPNHVIVDDMHYEFPHLYPHLVACHPSLGISHPETQKELEEKLRKAFETASVA